MTLAAALDYNRAVIGLRLAGALAGALAVVASGAGAAQGEVAERALTPPRVVAAVFSAGGPVDRVMLLFDHEVGPEAVRARVSTLGELCGSRARDLKISYDPFVSVWQANQDRAAGREESVAVTQTMVRFEMAGLADWKGGTLAVKPFVQAFQDDLPLRVVYNVGRDFPYREPVGADSVVDGVLVRHFPGATSHQFDVMRAAVPPSPPAKTASGPVGASAQRWMKIMIGLAVAIAVTVLVLIGLIAYGARRQPAQDAGRAKAGPETDVASPGNSGERGESEKERGEGRGS